MSQKSYHFYGLPYMILINFWSLSFHFRMQTDQGGLIQWAAGPGPRAPKPQGALKIWQTDWQTDRHEQTIRNNWASTSHSRNVCLRRYSIHTNVRNMTLTFDLWPWKPFREFILTWWIFLTSFIEIRPLSKEISRYVKQTLTDGQWTYRQTANRNTQRLSTPNVMAEEWK